MRLKTILSQSNPSVIREFEISSNSTVDLLLNAVRIMHGWDKKIELSLINTRFVRDEKGELKVVNESVELSETLDSLELQCVFITAPMKQRNLYYHYDKNKTENDKWLFLLEPVDNRSEAATGAAEVNNSACETTELENVSADNTASEINAPELIRFRGFNPPSECDSIVRCNTAFRDLENSGYTYINGERINYADAMVNRNEINRKLNRLIAQKTESDKIIDSFKVEMNYGKALNYILGTYSVDLLKAAMQNHEYSVKYMSNKARFVQDIAAFYKQNKVWESVLADMNMEEYRIFKQYVSKTMPVMSVRMQNFPVLRGYCLITEYGGKLAFSINLLDYYDEFMNRVGDSELIKRKQVKAAIEVCSFLYGVFDRTACQRVYLVLYPNNDVNDDFEEHWQNIMAKAGTKSYYYYYITEASRYCRMDGSYLLDLKRMNNSIARELLKNENYNRLDYYIPTPNECEKILSGQMLLEREYYGPIYDELSTVRKSYYASDLFFVIEDTVKHLQNGKTVRWVIDEYLKYRFYFDRGYDFSNLEKNMEKLKENIRVRELKGWKLSELG